MDPRSVKHEANVALQTALQTGADRWNAARRDVLARLSQKRGESSGTYARSLAAARCVEEAWDRCASDLEHVESAWSVGLEETVEVWFKIDQAIGDCSDMGVAV